ncbi:efflux RND transporter periplasmic adaptor subunit [Pararhodobacter aggregans]|uniref:efflux RND transporter periplasmic adaptor subunit n=1 Tax=Pararhodobacter aggregans TaxID=404875 RepID=UPI003A8D8D5B
MPRPPLSTAGLWLALALTAAPALADEATPAVTVAAASIQPLMQVVPVSGSLVARNEVLVFPHSGGFAITELAAEVGDSVTAGETVARLDDRTLRLRVTQAEAVLANARAGLAQAESQVNATAAQLRQANQVQERLRSLRASGTATQSALDEAETAQLGAAASAQSALDGVQAARAALQQAQASLDVAQLDYANARITSPVAGVVSARNGQIGAIASTGGEPIYRIIEEGTVEAVAEVIETELVLLSPGDPASLQIAGLPPVTGQVRLVAPTVSATTRLGEVRIALEGREGLRPGLYVGGQIIAEDRQGLAVPVSAVLRDARGAYVLRLGEGDTLERRGVETGIAWDGWQEVTAGLAEGDEVVSRAGAFFGEGDVVRPIRAEGPSETETTTSTGADQ